MLLRQFFLLVTSILYISTKAQEPRVNVTLPKYGKTLWELRSAAGWINDEGQWISRPNRIPVQTGRSFRRLMDFEKYGLGTDNFIFFQLREITIDNNHLFILLKFFKHGWYTYDAIERDWNNDFGYCYYVFDSTEMKHLIEVKMDTLSTVILHPIFIGESASNIKPSTVFSDILHDLAIPTENASRKFVFDVGVYKSKNLFRFQFYNYDNIGYGVYHFGGVAGYEDHTLELGYFTNNLFNNCYFEATYSAFAKLFDFIRTL